MKFSNDLREYLRKSIGKTISDVRFVEGYGKAQIILVFTDAHATVLDFSPDVVIGTKNEQETPNVGGRS